ncbi:unnamed protein product [Cylindrotheca closterium]|uniref:FAD dependent oxidoreductase domain-containing protein n=1 Tax=Cylindrotheca closterium TaxID=2856 RepID=A0AAD2G0V1_9STRA|nr:unnamed protein product [Cylindrotheca closterium]
MRIILSTCCLTALILGVTGFTNPTPTITFTSSATDSASASTNTQLAASYGYVNARPTNNSNNDNNNGGNAPRKQLNRRRRKMNKDVVIVGGGLAGLSAALYLSQIDPNRQITILDKHDLFDGDGKTSVATFAAAGMLAPQSERLPKGDYLDLCLASKSMYPEFTDLVECMAQEAGDEGAPYLNHKDNDKLEPWNIGYVASGGFLAPAFAGDTVATWAPPSDSKGNAMWLDDNQVRELEPNLHPEVIGGWWFPEDASVDARRLAASLRAACVGAGVQLMAGKNYEVSSLDLENGNCNGLWLKNGKYIQTNTCLVANGAWMRQLLPVPMEPHKGQSLSLRMPADRPPILRRVLFASDSYIVPKADGRIIIGATVEAGSYDPNVTPAGLMHILSYALQLVPALADLPLEETWAGLRPTTPDKGPILGKTPWEGLYLAGGYWRNGVLLAPKTGELLAMLIAGEELSQEDEKFLEAFAWDRFTSKDGGAEMAANARYAASMYPVHSRKSGAGVAASVGTELGSYSTAVSAGEERRKDREALFGGDDGIEALEKAAAAGKKDGAVFSFGGGEYKPPTATPAVEVEEVQEDTSKVEAKAPKSVNGASGIMASAEKKEGRRKDREAIFGGDDGMEAMEKAAAAGKAEGSDLSFGGGEAPMDVNGSTSTTAPETPSSEDDHEAEVDEAPAEDLQSIYQKIRENKSKQTHVRNDPVPDDRPDPGFRIFHVAEDGTEREVPPYTSPGEFQAMIEKESTAPTQESTTSIEEEVASAAEPTVPTASAEAASTGGFLNSMEGANDFGIHAAKVPRRNEKAPTNAKKTKAVSESASEGSFDGYQTILEAAANDDDIRKTMRENRMKNRMLEDDNTGYLSKVDKMMSERDTPASSSSTEEEEIPTDLSAVYQKIRDQKAAVKFTMNDPTPDDRPDPGFRIFHVAEDGTEREVPPYTSPGEFQAMIEKEEATEESTDPTANGGNQQEANGTEFVLPPETVSEEESVEYDEKTLDGYQTILSANGSTNREDEMTKMREARRKNRLGITD